MTKISKKLFWVLVFGILVLFPFISSAQVVPNPDGYTGINTTQLTAYQRLPDGGYYNTFVPASNSGYETVIYKSPPGGQDYLSEIIYTDSNGVKTFYTATANSPIRLGSAEESAAIDQVGGAGSYNIMRSFLSGRGVDSYYQANNIAQNNSPTTEGELSKRCLPGWLQINFEWCAASISYLLLKLAAYILWAVGVLFNFVINFTVVNMAGSIQKITALNTTWKVFRDLANLSFIFILLYVAISTILRLSGPDTKKLLVNLVIMALLINFSLFFTKVIIDSSNRLAYEFYSRIAPGNQSLTGCDGIRADCGLSDAFLKPLELNSIYNPSSDSRVAFAPTSAELDKAGGWRISVVSILGTLVILIAAMVFLGGAVLFIVRYITLVVLMLFSALAFTAMILPKTSQLSKEWWGKLLSEALVAPAFFLMIWATLQLIGGGLLSTNSGSFASFAAGSRTAVGVLMNFALVIGLLFASLLMAKITGASGAGLALQTYNGVRRTAQGWLGRNTLGEIGRSAEEYFARKKWANLAPFDALRNITTRQLSLAKFGGDTSRMEAYKKGQERAETRLAAQHANEARHYEEQLRKVQPEKLTTEKEIKDYKEKFGKYQEALAKLTPHELETVFSRAELKGNGMLLDAMSTEQRKYITEEGEKLSGKEKDQAGETWAKHFEADLAKIKTIEADYNKNLSPKDADKALNENYFFNKFRKTLRGFSMKDAELIYRTRPELLTDKKFTQYFSANLVDKIKQEAQWIGKAGKDKLREAKFHTLYAAIDEAEAAAAAGDIGAQTIAERKIQKALLDRNAKEMLMLDFKHRNSRFLQQHFSVQEAKSMNSRNQDDIEKYHVALNLLEAHRRGQMTENQVSLWKYWAESKDREALSFFSAATRQHLKAPEWNEELSKQFVREYRNRVDPEETDQTEFNF